MVYDIGNPDENLRDINAKTGTHHMQDPNNAASTQGDSNFHSNMLVYKRQI
jgi:hypothetical protein